MNVNELLDTIEDLLDMPFFCLRTLKAPLSVFL